MINSFLIGIGGIVFMMIVWVMVQSKWRDIFADEIADEDVLAGRSSCGDCGCTTVCRTRQKELTTE